MAAFVRKRLSDVFRHEDASSPSSPTRYESVVSQPDSGYESGTKNASQVRVKEVDSELSTPTAGYRSIVARDSLEVFRSVATATTSPKPSCPLSKVTLRQRTAGTLKRLSESIKLKRQDFRPIIDLFSGEDKPSVESIPTNSKDSDPQERVNFQSKAHHDDKPRLSKQSLQNALSAGSLSARIKRYSHAASVKSRNFGSTRRFRLPDKITRRRRSETDTSGQGQFDDDGLASLPPKLTLDLSQLKLSSPRESRAISKSSRSSVSQEPAASGLERASSTSFPEAIKHKNEGSDRTSDQKNCGDRRQTSEEYYGRSETLTHPSMTPMTLSATRTRTGDSVFFKGQRDSLQNYRGKSPFRAQMLRKSQDQLDVPTYQQIDYHVPAPQEKGHVKVTRGYGWPITNNNSQKSFPEFSHSESDTQSDPPSPTGRLSILSISTLSDRDSLPELELQSPAPSPEGTGPDLSSQPQSMTRSLGNIHFPTLHPGEADFPKASCVEVASEYHHPTQTCLSGSALVRAVEAIDRCNGNELGGATNEDDIQDTISIDDRANPPFRPSIQTRASAVSDVTTASCAITTERQPMHSNSLLHNNHHRTPSVEALESCKEPIAFSEELKRLTKRFKGSKRIAYLRRKVH